MSIDAKSININMTVTGNFASEVARNGAGMQTFGNQAHAGMAKAQTGMQKFGAVAGKLATGAMIGVAIGLALSAKAAISFESSFAGVRKTVEASEPQFQRLAMGVRTLAKEIPIGVNELNKIMELGGQLGVNVGGLLPFTETIALIGVTTTLMTEEAALGFARLDNIMQLGGGSFDRIGSSIVDLGNNFAATEDEILSFALRIAPIAQTVGVTTDEVLAIATAFTSVGIPAERGGTAIQKVLLRISDAAIDGGANLATFADLAGLTSDEFKRLVETDPAAAFESFIVGLKRVIDSGESTTPIFEALGLGNERVRNSMLAMANASNVLTDALNTGKSSWYDNIALTEEAEKRFETFASQLGIFKNKIVDVGIGIGQELLPFLGDLLIGFETLGGWVAGAIDLFKGWNGILKTVTIGLAALITTMWLANAHPYILAIGAIAAAIGFLGKQAREAAERTERLQDILGKGFTTKLDLEEILGHNVVNALMNAGFSESNIQQALLGTEEQADRFYARVAAIWETGASDNSLQLAANGVDWIPDDNLFNAIAVVGKGRDDLGTVEQDMADIVGRINELKIAGKPYPGEDEFNAMILRRQEIERRYREGLGQIEPIELNPVELSEENIADVKAGLADYEMALDEGFEAIAQEVEDSIDLLYEFDKKFSIAWKTIFANLQRQMTATFDFEKNIEGLGLSDQAERILRGWLPSPQAKEAFNKAIIEGIFPDGTTFDELIAAAEEFAQRFEDEIFRRKINASDLLEFTYGQELLDELKRITKEIVDDDTNTYSPGAAFMAVLKTAFNEADSQSARDRITGVLNSLLLDPEERGNLGLTIQQVSDLLDELNGMPAYVETTVHIKFIDDRPDDLQFNVPVPYIEDPNARNRAFGGSLMKNEPSWVGEHGPELFMPYASGTIIPNSKLNSGSNETTYNLTINGSEDVADDGRVTLLTAQMLGAR